MVLVVFQQVSPRSLKLHYQFLILCVQIVAELYRENIHPILKEGICCAGVPVVDLPVVPVPVPAVMPTYQVTLSTVVESELDPQ